MNNEVICEEIVRGDLYDGACLYVSGGKGGYQVVLANPDGSEEIPLAAAKELGRAREMAATIEIPSFAYEMIGIGKPAEQPGVVMATKPADIQDLLVEKLGEDAVIEIELGGWAHYKFDENNGAPWIYRFDDIPVARWYRDNPLGDLTSVEIERGWELLEMDDGATISQIMIKCGDKVFTKDYPGDEEPATCECEDVVEKLIFEWLGE